MKCKLCVEHINDKKIDLVVGSVSYKKDTLNKHNKSKIHEKAVLISEAKSKPKGESSAAKMIKTLNQNVLEKLDKMFRNCHAIVMKNRPLSDYIWLCQLDEMKGLNLGQTYRNQETAKVFINAIAEVEFQKVAALFYANKFLCVIGDGSTDSSVTEQDMWYVRTCNSGKIETKFIGVASMVRANAEGITNGLKYLVSQNLKLQWNDFAKKLVAVSCDGASVMVGSRSGVATLLRKDQPALITLHCMAHRLELTLKDAAKKQQLFNKAISVLAMGLYYFYRNSYLNRSMLKTTYAALQQKEDQKLLIPCRAGGTRWIGHQLRAVTNLLRSYKFICNHLEQVCC